MKQWETYKFKIEAYTPDSLPMIRLAAYLRELSEMLGEAPYVHFVRLESGSSTLVHKIEKEALPKVMERIDGVKKAKGNVVAMRAYERINRMLIEDNGTGRYMKTRKNVLITFPGIDDQKLKFPAIQQQGEIDGEIIRVGGPRDEVPILMEVDGKELSGCYAKRSVAKELAKSLFEPVRLYGVGRWRRSPDGEWTLEHFNVDRFIELEKTTLSQAVVALRGLEGKWEENSLREILESRNSEEDDG